MISNYTSTLSMSILTYYCSDTSWQKYSNPLYYPEHYIHPYKTRYLDYITSLNFNGGSHRLVITEPILCATLYHPDAVTVCYYPENIFIRERSYDEFCIGYAHFRSRLSISIMDFLENKYTHKFYLHDKITLFIGSPKIGLDSPMSSTIFQKKIW